MRKVQRLETLYGRTDSELVAEIAKYAQREGMEIANLSVLYREKYLYSYAAFVVFEKMEVEDELD